MPRVFISHSALDRDRVEREIIAPLRTHGIDTWYSKDDIRVAGVWERNIREALEECDWFLVVLTPRSVASEWVQTEVHWALDRRATRVVPVLLEECRPEDLNLRLLRIQHLDFRAPTDETRARLLEVWHATGDAETTTGRATPARGATAGDSVSDAIAATGRYTPVRTIGHSTKGTLVSARDHKLDMDVAVRVVDVGAWPADARAKLVADTRAALRLAHPAVVRYLDVVEQPTHVLVATEFLTGTKPLTEIMWAGTTPERAAEILSQMASGVQYLHGRGIVHRWLRPSTVLVDDRGPHITDLGFESAARDTAVGSPTYAAPELLSGELSDGRSDIYSMGVILYEMLAGRRPFEAAGPDAMFAALREKLTRPSEVNAKVPKELERICLKCLSLRSAERYASAADLSQDLRTWKDRENKFRFWPFS